MLCLLRESTLFLPSKLSERVQLHDVRFGLYAGGRWMLLVWDTWDVCAFLCHAGLLYFALDQAVLYLVKVLFMFPSLFTHIEIWLPLTTNSVQAAISVFGLSDLAVTVTMSFAKAGADAESNIFRR